MENSVNETEKLLSSRLPDWPGCLEGRERRVKGTRRDKERKNAHNSLHMVGITPVRCLKCGGSNKLPAQYPTCQIWNTSILLPSSTAIKHPREKPALVWWVSSPVFFFFAKQKGAEVNFHWKATTVRHIFHSHQQYRDTASAVNRLQNSQTGWRECKHTCARVYNPWTDELAHTNTQRGVWGHILIGQVWTGDKKKMPFFTTVMFCCNKIKLFA